MRRVKTTNKNQIYVWDIVVRLFHWALVLFFIIAFASGDDFMLLHEFAGYTIGSLILLRVVWGLIGSRYARFSSFLTRRPLDEAKCYLKDMVKGRPKRHFGHNPAGGLMIILLLLSLLGTVVTGILALDSSGPTLSLFRWQLSELAEELHQGFTALLILLVSIHLLGVVVSSLVHGENLIRAMVTGHKREKSEKNPDDSSVTSSTLPSPIDGATAR